MAEVKWPSDRVRSTFIDYFTKKCDHLFVPSSPVVPYDDPTLLFANSGMTQFKPIFLGNIDPKSPQASWKRAANSQKCIRAGGKHNDLDDVGKDTYHHTFFEMLGNWSFANYFQKEAIDWAWDLLVNTFGLEPRRIYVTYFKGDEADGLPPDNEAKALWKKYLPESRILPFGKKENFWEMGDTGPCGPCSEIHYDRRSDREDASSLVNMDSPEVIEIWNLVFMAFNREQSRALTPLPHKHVDTGMGFERLTSILQDKPSNYDTDVFQPLFDRIHELTGAPPYSGLVGEDDEKGPHPGKDTAYRIVADHIRTLVFAITDGAVPSCDGRGYVLRRILRRAVRAGRHYLNAKDNFFHQLVDTVINKCGGFFPELKTNPERVRKIIKYEEEQFQGTLNRGIQKFKRITKDSKFGDVLSGEDTFYLYGTYGFPLDLIEIMAHEIGMKIDHKRFQDLVEEERQRSLRAYAASKSGVVFELKAAAISQLQDKGIKPTNDSFKYLRDEPLYEGATVQAIWKGDPEKGSFVEVAEGECGVVLNSTNFYAESGGQLYDTGFLQSDNCRFIVKEVKVYGGYVAHIGVLQSGSLKVGDSVTCALNLERRRPIMANHTSTHLINLALRKTLKDPSDQRGSIVSDEKFRFDFTCSQALTPDEVQSVEKIVNEIISNDLDVHIKEVPLAIATKLHNSVRHIFAEAYPDPVRVVSVGCSVDDILAGQSEDKWMDFSIEFCGGTHLSKTSQAETFCVISEEACQMGERRIVAVTGERARRAHEESRAIHSSIEKLCSSSLPVDQLQVILLDVQQKFNKATIPHLSRVDGLKKLKSVEEKIKQINKKEHEKHKESAEGMIPKIVEGVKTSEHKVVVAFLEAADNKMLGKAKKDIAASCKKDLNLDVPVLLFTFELGKKKSVQFHCLVPDCLSSKFTAVQWTSAVTVHLGGKPSGSKVATDCQGNAPFSEVEGLQQRVHDFALNWVLPHLK